jgi:hypothetical protein
VRRLPATLLLIAFVAAGCGGGARKDVDAVNAASLPAAKRLLKQHLDAQQLDYTWIACVRNGREYRNVPVTRCNVGFGIDPHVTAYCIVLKGGELATNFTDPAIPCGHDNAGWDGTTITSS